MNNEKYGVIIRVLTYITIVAPSIGDNHVNVNINEVQMVIDQRREIIHF